MRRHRPVPIGSWTVIAAVITVLAGCVATAPGTTAATLTRIGDFGANPGGIEMHLYVPAGVAARPGVLVVMHGCNGRAADFHRRTEFASLADEHGFVVVYPQGNKSANGLTNCFDVWSDEALRHGGGGDPGSIVSMVDYVVRRHGGDPARVFATGFSSGAMQTVNLLATYPDVFQAGAAFAGVPFGCLGPPGCSDRSPREWGDLVRDAHPGHQGPRPRLMTWHGTVDDVLEFGLLEKQVEQWTDVHGVSPTPTSTTTPAPGWTLRRYGSGQVEAYTVTDAGHDLPHPGMAAHAIHFFGLDRK
ncbi:alpha/beta hydrolase family esterase [Nonomuraea sp. NPDC048826]|uniref:extracellular catalytic domain type 1 short-chain-length polyhydroxyalkanoate depolymerase n=1 Tax=Nonomuraea sp. NPDC048826 TaxID=3364347 RepID=UPI0037147059